MGKRATRMVLLVPTRVKLVAVQFLHLWRKIKNAQISEGFFSLQCGKIDRK
jgi:hypothetical protein